MDWDDLRLFQAVAEAGSARKAARALGVHHATVNRRIERLEEALEARLIERHPDGAVLTEAGEEVLFAARNCTDAIGRAGRMVSGRDTGLSGTVRLTMPEPLAALGLAPRLPEFAETYPDIALDLRITMNMLDLSRGDADVAVRIDNNPPDYLVGKRLFAYTQTIYATPEYLAAHDLTGDPASARFIGWSLEEGRHPGWIRETAFRDVPAYGAFPNLPCQVAAAEAGLGLAMLPCFVADRLPGLVRATDRQPVEGRDIWVLTHPDLRRTARIRAVMNFAEDVLRRDRALFRGEAA